MIPVVRLPENGWGSLNCPWLAKTICSNSTVTLHASECGADDVCRFMSMVERRTSHPGANSGWLCWAATPGTA